jgi:alkanesulfonate monooxygenase SsuD/methylene tetrahydromethanopterin reductase-like flavin-dependent oxidoreductase (luciferase family)
VRLFTRSEENRTAEGNMQIPVGLNVWSRLVGEVIPYLDQAAGPFDSLWFPDHVQYDHHNVAEGWSTMLYALARYPDKQCGHEVLCNSFRNPALLAKMAATAQALSGGRVVLGIGAGWQAEEYRAYGWAFPSAKVRIEQLAEAIELIRALWSTAPASYQGRHYQIAGAYCAPQPEPRVPIMVGGSGEQYLLRVVARHADWWNYDFKDAATYTHKQAVLRQHCDAVGRNYDDITQVVRVGVLIAETEQEAQQIQARPETRPLEHGAIGTPEQVAELLLSIVRQGAHRLTVYFADAPRPDGAALFAATVLPYLAR